MSYVEVSLPDPYNAFITSPRDLFSLNFFQCDVQKAAKGGRLSEHQYLRQNLGLAVTGVMTLFYLWKTPAMVLEPVYQK